MPLISVYHNSDKQDVPTEFECSLVLNNPNLSITTQYPLQNVADNNAWRGVAYSNGRINLQHNTRNYFQLFYEAKLPPKQTLEFKLNDKLCPLFVVSGSQAEEFLQVMITDCLQYNVKESNDFITLFLPHLENNNYNLVQFVVNEKIEEVVLSVTPNPVKLIRCHLLFESYDSWDRVLDVFNVNETEDGVFENKFLKLIKYSSAGTRTAFQTAFNELKQQRGSFTHGITVTEWGGSNLLGNVLQ